MVIVGSTNSKNSHNATCLIHEFQVIKNSIKQTFHEFQVIKNTHKQSIHDFQVIKNSIK